MTYIHRLAGELAPGVGQRYSQDDRSVINVGEERPHLPFCVRAKPVLQGSVTDDSAVLITLRENVTDIYSLISPLTSKHRLTLTDDLGSPSLCERNVKT